MKRLQLALLAPLALSAASPSLAAPPHPDPLALVAAYIESHNAHDAERAIAYYAEEAEFHLSEGRGVVRGRDAILQLELLDVQLGSWLAPQGLRVRREEGRDIVDLELVIERSEIASALGVPIILAQGIERAFVIVDGRFTQVRQPAFRPACSRVMGATTPSD